MRNLWNFIFVELDYWLRNSGHNYISFHQTIFKPWGSITNPELGTGPVCKKEKKISNDSSQQEGRIVVELSCNLIKVDIAKYYSSLLLNRLNSGNEVFVSGNGKETPRI